MTKPGLPIIILATAVLGGCVGIATDKASNQLADICEERGDNMRIAQPKTGIRGGIIGHVYASGDCIAEGDEGYDDALTIEEYRARIGRKPE
ncbi:MAG: hypothetical protein WA954_09955 [Parerythrobacter sp.]